MEESARVQGASKEIQLIQMKYIVASFMLALAVVASELPPVAKPGQGALLSAGLIYPLEGRLTPQCHASTIVQTTGRTSQ